jgi:methylated-DNA-[protein]-cysteine S-methyltransferase
MEITGIKIMKVASLRFDELDTPIGPLRLQFDSDGLHAVTIVRGQHADADSGTGPHERYPRKDAFERYFDGNLDALAGLSVIMNGTEFQQRVWQTLRTIPSGTAISYMELAKRIGNSKAMRAVGSANGRNPLCIVVPCHRVISADGSLGGFSAGLDAKRWLLRHEGVAFKA